MGHPCDELVELLLRCEAVCDPGQRELILKRLGIDVRSRLERLNVLRADVVAIVTGCYEHRAIDELLAAIRYFEGETRAMRAIDAWYADWRARPVDAQLAPGSGNDNRRAYQTPACTPQAAADWCRRHTESVSKQLVDHGIYQPAMYVERSSLDAVVSRVSGVEPSVTIVIGRSGVGKTSWLATVATRSPLDGRAVLLEGRFVGRRCNDLIEAVDEELGRSRGLTGVDAQGLAEVLGPGQAVFILDALDQLTADSPAARSAWLDLSLRRARELTAHVIVSCRPDSWGLMDRPENNQIRVVFLDDFSRVEFWAAAVKQKIELSDHIAGAMAHPFYLRLYADMGSGSVSPIELSDRYIDRMCRNVAKRLRGQRPEDVHLALRDVAEELRGTRSLEIGYERCRDLVRSPLLPALIAEDVLINASDALRFRFDEIAEALIAERLDASGVNVDAVADPASEPTIAAWVKLLWRLHMNSERHGDRDALLYALLRRLGMPGRRDAGVYADVKSLLPFFAESNVPQRIDFAALCLRIFLNRWSGLPGDLLERLRVPIDQRPGFVQDALERLDPYPWERKRWYRDPTNFAFHPSERGLFVDVLAHEVPKNTAMWMDVFERWLVRSKPQSRVRNVAAGCLFYFRHLDRAHVMDAVVVNDDSMLVLLAEHEAEETRAVFRDWIAKDHRAHDVGETVLHRVDYDSMENDVSPWIELVRPLVGHSDVVTRGYAAAVLLHDPRSREIAIPEVLVAMNEPMSSVTAWHLWPALDTHARVVVDRVKGLESWHLVDLIRGWSRFLESVPGADGSELIALMRSQIGNDPGLDHAIVAALERWLLTVGPIPRAILAEIEALGLELIRKTSLNDIKPIVYATGRPVDVAGSDAVRAAWATALFAKPEISDVAIILVKALAVQNWRLRGGAIYVDRLVAAVGEPRFAQECWYALLQDDHTARRVRDWFESEPPFEPKGELAEALASS